MDVGRLNQSIELLKREEGKSAWGEATGTWAVYDTVWAWVKLLPGMELIRASAEVLRVRASFRIRYRDGITSGLRVRYMGQVYDVRGVALTDDRRFYDLACEECDDQV